ncbi:Gfo/Idh/MocA family oxidoreductase [Sinomonas sp. JGH33]|uniref:Gfo/Idh/MocA family oxidoreductase n=2 Tax=Sinomonas terricola TaxID=3110330 RepID=A0ABU5TAT0_9MICC|nr:Gfo/Idh/MocA family oxidoreductase [Sinomonas sp. JGH33]MEA5456683.1 Gfo/Idh/MocA family oxidoreductase [Sinomonas sp. JGH33]
MSGASLGVAVVGAGYWGSHLARTFYRSDEWDLIAVCDLDLDRAAALAGLCGAKAFGSLDEALDTVDVDAVAIATPARTHYGVALTALGAGKHVLVEKPLADRWDKGADMVRAAQEGGLVLMVDHTYCFTPVVQKMRELLLGGELGDILYVDSVRINPGLVQPDVDVFWDLAPHDLSILDFVLPDGLTPDAVSAHGADPLGTGRDCVGHLSFDLPDGAMAHIHVNWLSPPKIRQMVVGGTRRTLVWDDLSPRQPLSVYDCGGQLPMHGGRRSRSALERGDGSGDRWSPALPEREALGQMVGEFAGSIRSGRPSTSSASSALRVLRVLEAAGRSLQRDGAQAPIDAGTNAVPGSARQSGSVRQEAGA